jgi:hypothetical protein
MARKSVVKVTDLKDKTRDAKKSSKMTSEQELADNICLLISGWAYRTGMPIDKRINIAANHARSAIKIVDMAREKYIDHPTADNLDILLRMKDKHCKCWNCRIVRMYEFFDLERNDSINKTDGELA